MKVDPETDCSQWYQIIRPIVLGCLAREPPEIKSLDLAGECTAEFWSKVPWELAKYPRKREFYSFVQSPNDEYLKKLGKTPSCRDVAAVRRKCSEQNAKNDGDYTFWDAVDPAHLECSDETSNLEAINEYLGKRRSDLERALLGNGEDLFGKFGQGFFGEDGEQPYTDDDQRMNMLDGFRDDDVFDKNHPITGEVGFWRDETDGTREFTNLDEPLDLGDLENDGDFRKYLVLKGLGRFDSKGNFISTSGDVLPSEDGKSDADRAAEKLKWKGKRTGYKGKSTITRIQADRKPRKYPNWEFPMCNYPRWVHQMYRMDQVKIGQLVKQGSRVPQYCSAWTVCRDQDKMQGNLNVNSKNEVSREGKFDQDRDVVKHTTSQTGGRKTVKHAKIHRQVKWKQGQDEASRGMKYPVDSESSDDLNEFLEKFEKEQQELSRLETDSYGQLIQKDEFADVTDLIDEYQRKLREEDDLMKDAISRKRAEEKKQMIKRKRDAERKALAALQKKKLQEESQNRESFGRKKESLGRRSKYSGKSGVFPLRGDGADRRAAKRRPPPIVICRRITSWPADKAKEIECLDRFSELLGSPPERTMSQNKFIELAKQVRPLVQSAPPRKLTPCEKLKPKVASALG